MPKTDSVLSFRTLALVVDIKALNSNENIGHFYNTNND